MGTSLVYDAVHCAPLGGALLGDPPVRMESMTVRLQQGTGAVRAKPRASPIVHISGDENRWRDLLSRWVTRPGVRSART